MSEERNILHWRIISIILGISFVGLFICAILEKVFPSEPNTTEISVVRAFIIFFSFFWVLGLMVLVPIQILYFQRKARKNKILEKATAKDIVGLPFGAFNPNAEVPKWISIPIKLLIGLVVGIFVLVLLSVMLGLIFTKET